MKSNAVVWFEIYVEDMLRAKKFYESVFMQKLEKITTDDPAACEFEMWMFPMKEDAMGAGGALTKMDGVKPSTGGTLIYFACNDCAIEQQRVVEHGGSVQVSKFSIGENGFAAIVTDTEGNRIGLHSMK